jgi:hypothetical protein
MSPPTLTASLFIVVSSTGSRLLDGKQRRERVVENSDGKKAAGTQRQEESGGKVVVGKLLAGKRWKVPGVAGKRALGVELELPALPIGSCRARAGTGAPTHLLGSYLHRLIN